MFASLLQLDREIFSQINGFHDAVLDTVMYWASNRFIWIPLYAWVLYLVIKHHRSELKIILPSVSIMILITDQFSVFVKNNVLRLRPCHDPYFSNTIHLVNDSCGGMYGFVSSHATNTMSLVLFLCLLLPKESRWVKIELIAWTLLVSYSRVYLGAHFPGDILGGWLIGIMAALISFQLYSLVKKRIASKTQC